MFWVGSTFDWEDKSLKATEKARQKLIEQISETLNGPFEVVEQIVGVRPTVKDRRPILGCHEEEPRLCIFNGMGTRGVMLAPYFAREMADYLESGKSLDREVDISRFT